MSEEIYIKIYPKNYIQSTVNHEAKHFRRYKNYVCPAPSASLVRQHCELHTSFIFFQTAISSLYTE